jgi:hypothetical protein
MRTAVRFLSFDNVISDQWFVVQSCFEFQLMGHGPGSRIVKILPKALQVASFGANLQASQPHRRQSSHDAPSGFVPCQLLDWSGLVTKPSSSYVGRRNGFDKRRSADCITPHFGRDISSSVAFQNPSSTTSLTTYEDFFQQSVNLPRTVWRIFLWRHLRLGSLQILKIL